MTYRGELASALVTVMLASMVGCGPDGPQVVKVSGTVTHAGKPVSGLLVNFSPERGRASSGITDKDGHYTLNYERGRPGAVVGRHKVWFKAQAANPKEEAELAQGVMKLRPEVLAILAKYGDEQSTPLAMDVKQDNQVIDLPVD